MARKGDSKAMGTTRTVSKGAKGALLAVAGLGIGLAVWCLARRSSR
jgi:threonine/homoserine/homoserine lactone efflux protein